MSALRKAQAEFLLDIGKLVVFATSLGFEVTGGELWRPAEMQKLYVQTGRSKTMNSLHGDRLAEDLNFFLDGKYVADVGVLRKVGAYWESLHPLNSWGGNGVNFKDAPHFSRGLTKPEWRRVT